MRRPEEILAEVNLRRENQVRTILNGLGPISESYVGRALKVPEDVIPHLGCDAEVLRLVQQELIKSGWELGRGNARTNETGSWELRPFLGS